MSILKSMTKDELYDLVVKSDRIQSFIEFEIEHPAPEGSHSIADFISKPLINVISAVYGEEKLQKALQAALGTTETVHLEEAIGDQLSAFVSNAVELDRSPAEAGHRLNNLFLTQVLAIKPEQVRDLDNQAAIETLIYAGVLGKKDAQRLDAAGQFSVNDFFWRAMKIESALNEQVLNFNVTASLDDTLGQVASFESPSGTPFNALEAASITAVKFNAFKHVFGEDEIEYLAKKLVGGMNGLDHHGEKTVLFANETAGADVKVLFLVDDSKIGRDFNSEGYWRMVSGELNDIMDRKLKALQPQDVQHVKDPATLETLSKLGIIENGGFGARLRVLQEKGVVGKNRSSDKDDGYGM